MPLTDNTEAHGEPLTPAVRELVAGREAGSGTVPLTDNTEAHGEPLTPALRELDGQWLLNGPGCPFRGMNSSGIGWWCLGTIWNVLHASELHILKWLK